MGPLQPEAAVRLVDGFVDLVREQVVRGERAVSLSTREAQLLSYLAARPGEVVSRDELLTRVWEYRASRPTRAVDVAMTRLRKKVEPDPAAPTHLISVFGEGYRFEPATSAAVPAVAAASSPADELVGRGPFLSLLAGTLETARLVTVLGTGGVGKTRVAREHAASAAGPSWFCDLSSARDLAAVAHGLATTLRVPPGDDVLTRVGHALAARGPCLVVLDNLEQVVEPARRAVEAWLELAPAARLLVTSRAPLRARGEHILELGPLTEDEGVSLLVRRAAAIGGRWAGEPDVLREIVRRLDGLPLALELAAGRARTLSPAALRDRLDERFRLLRGGRPGRHVTLEAALDWSWELLSAEEQRMLAWLSVFRGGFTLEAVEEVCDLGDTWPVDTLDALRSRSLVAMDGDRFRLLETIRDYAARRLDAEDGVVERHARFYAAEGERLVPGIRGPASVERLEALDGERENLLAALDRTRAPTVRARLALVLAELLRLKGPVDLVRPVLAGPLADLDAVGAALRARLLAVSANDHEVNHRPAEALEDAEAAVAVAPPEEPAVAAEAWFRLAYVRYRMRRHDEALEQMGEAAALYHLAGDLYGEAAVLGSMGVILRGLDRHDEGRASAERAAHLFHLLGDDRGEAISLANLGRFHLRDGHFEEAAGLIARATDRMRAVGDEPRLATILAYYATPVAVSRGDLPRAAALLAEAAELHRRVGSPSREALVRLSLSSVTLECGGPEEARGHLAETRRLAAEGASLDVDGAGPILLHLADLLEGLALLEDDPAAARDGLRRGAEGCRRDGTDLARGWATFNLGVGLLRTDPAGAREALEEALGCAERSNPATAPAVRALLAVAHARLGADGREWLADAGEGLGLTALARALLRGEPVPALPASGERELMVERVDLYRAARVLGRLAEG